MLCFVGSLAAFLASTHQIPARPPACCFKCKDVETCWKISPVGILRPFPVKTSWVQFLSDNIILKKWKLRFYVYESLCVGVGVSPFEGRSQYGVFLYVDHLAFLKQVSQWPGTHRVRFRQLGRWIPGTCCLWLLRIQHATMPQFLKLVLGLKLTSLHCTGGRHFTNWATSQALRSWHFYSDLNLLFIL